MKIKYGGRYELTLFDIDKGLMYGLISIIRAFSIIKKVELKEVSIKAVKKKPAVPRISKKDKAALMRSHDFRLWRERRKN
ncbi:MAG: hypothetical protein KAV87_52035 [Desulfobacteraceae bacterium]|nr:hypothetical protein [Desulfobacteraceae bacterium]